MSGIMEQSLWYKMRYTPIRDILQGKITARLDLRRLLEEAALPPLVKQLIHRVAGKTRLWRLEKVDVTLELINHFADGIAAGVSPEELIQAFGNETEAATLIRRAKRRNRGPSWQAFRVAGWAMAALFVFYCAFAIYFFTGRPSPGPGYIARVNQTIQKTPLEDRAWPAYRRALIGIGAIARRSMPAPMFDARPGMNEWPRLLDFVTRHQAEVELIRQGSAKPILGFLIGGNGSIHDAELWPDRKPAVVDPVTGQEQESIRVQLPPFQFLRDMAGILRTDAVLAREAHDGKRLVGDLNSMLGLSRQVGENASLLGGFVSLTIYETALDQIELSLNQDPTLIGNEDWIALARRLSVPKVAGDLITFDFERMSFENMLQRSFTDDGSGNGRLTPEGVRYFVGSPEGRSKWSDVPFQPVFGLLVASRQRLESEYARLADPAAINLRLPMRETHWSSDQDELNRSHVGALDSINRMIVLPPAYRRAQETVERSLGRRDGLLAVIALEVFRREHGKYPENLAALVPQLLPEVPADRITGEPVRFRVVDSRPLIYSVGVDRKDDGGRPAREQNTQRWVMPLAESQNAAIWEAAPDAMPDGDWVLYPTLK